MIDLDKWHITKQTNYGADKLRELLTACGINERERLSLEDAGKACDHFGFGWFNQTYPHFPWQFECRKMSHGITIPHLFAEPGSQVELWRSYRDAISNYPKAISAGLICDHRGDAVPDLLAYSITEKLPTNLMPTGSCLRHVEADGSNVYVVFWRDFLDDRRAEYARGETSLRQLILNTSR